MNEQEPQIVFDVELHEAVIGILAGIALIDKAEDEIGFNPFPNSDEAVVFLWEQVKDRVQAYVDTPELGPFSVECEFDHITEMAGDTATFTVELDSEQLRFIGSAAYFLSDIDPESTAPEFSKPVISGLRSWIARCNMYFQGDDDYEPLIMQ